MNTSDFIKMLCQYNKVTVAEVARRIGQSSQNLTQKIKRGTVSMDEMAAIASSVGAVYNQSFIMPNREIISLNMMNDGSYMTVNENTTGRNLDVSLISNIFTALFYVDLEQDKGQMIYQAPWIAEKNNDSIKASESINMWIENAVHENDKERMKDRLSLSAIHERIRKQTKFAEYYRATNEEDKGYHEVLVVKSKKNDDRFVYICHIQRQDDIDTPEQQVLYKKTLEFSSNILWSAIEEVYQSCFICNLSINEFRQVQNGMNGESFEISDGTYDKFISSFESYIVNKRECEFFKNTFNRESLIKIFESGQTKAYCEFSARKEDGKECRIELRGILKRDMFDNIMLVLMISDVTEEYEKDNRLTELVKSDQDYMDILDTFTKKFIAAYKVNLDNDTYEILKFNERSKSLAEKFKKHGNSYSKNARLFIETFAHPDDVQAVLSTASLENLRTALKDKNEIVNLYRDISGGEPEYFEMHAISHKSKWGGNYAIMIFSNVDERVNEQMEKHRELKEALKEANAAVEAKKKFLFNMSHDIRTPMNAILGFAQIAMLNSSASPKLKECLEKIQLSGDSLLQIINDVLEMSNLESGSVGIDEQAVHSESIGKGILSMIQQAAFKKNIKFSYIVSNVVDEEVYCDLNHVNQILINLLTNAINFTPEGGKVCFTTEQIESRFDGEVSFCFTVEDNGVGISPSFIEHVFEPFAKEKTSTESGIEGTGLGLSIALRLAQIMKGRIEVESTVGKGSTFRFYVDFRRVRSLSRIKETEYEPVKVKPYRVLVADDDRLNREVVKKMLGVMGVQSEEVENGSLVIEKLKRNPNKYYSAILMDVQMPVLDGYQTTKAIRSLSDRVLSQIPIIAMTANEKSSDMKKCFNVGMDDFISKPINMKMLTAAIEHVMNNSNV